MVGPRLEQQQRALAQVVQDQRRQHQGEPRQTDGLPAEVSHVGIERFPAGDHQEDRPEHGEPDKAVVAEERDRVPRIEGAEDGRQA